MRARNDAGYDAPIGLTADPVVFTLLDGALCVLLARRLEEPQRGMFALPGGFVGAVRGARADRGAQAAREDRRRLGPPRAAAHLRRSRARSARLAALDRLHGAGARPRPCPPRRPPEPRRLLAPARRASRRWPSTTRGSSTTGSGGSARGWPTRRGSCAWPAACCPALHARARPSACTRRCAASPSTPANFRRDVLATGLLARHRATNAPRAQAARAGVYRRA